MISIGEVPRVNVDDSFYRFSRQVHDDVAMGNYCGAEKENRLLRFSSPSNSLNHQHQDR